MVLPFYCPSYSFFHVSIWICFYHFTKNQQRTSFNLNLLSSTFEAITYNTHQKAAFKQKKVTLRLSACISFSATNWGVPNSPRLVRRTGFTTTPTLLLPLLASSNRTVAPALSTYPHKTNLNYTNNITESVSVCWFVCSYYKLPIVTKLKLLGNYEFNRLWEPLPMKP